MNVDGVTRLPAAPDASTAGARPTRLPGAAASLLRDPGQEWYARSALDVAPELLGALLRVEGQRGAVVVRLTEVEAYHGTEDPGSHAFRGRTGRNAVMFGPPAHLYVYFTYGMHFCANLVCGAEGTASAVLLRAGEVVSGVGLARSRRPSARRDVDLARGPARLAGALDLTRADDGAPVEPGRRVSLRVLREPAADVHRGPRVGVAGPGGEPERFPWRFWLPGEATVSTYRPARPRRPRAVLTPDDVVAPDGVRGGLEPPPFPPPTSLPGPHAAD